MATLYNYITGRTSEFDELRTGIPIHIEAGGFLLCTSGCSDVVIDSKQYSIRAWDLMVALPHSYAHAIHTSDDFDGVILGVDIDILVNTQLSDKSFYIDSISQNHCISLQQDDAQKILSLREMFVRESANREHPMRSEIDEAIIKIIIYEIAALYRCSKPNVDHERSRDDVIFNNFVVQLHSDELFIRTLDHFALQQSITPSHLSKVVRRVSGRPASEWISDYTILSIKRLLKSGDASISSIAETMNFPNASFLAQYFKKHTSQSPSQFRAEHFVER